jgi:hypothetical protein
MTMATILRPSTVLRSAQGEDKRGTHPERSAQREIEGRTLLPIVA